MFLHGRKLPVTITDVSRHIMGPLPPQAGGTPLPCPLHALAHMPPLPPLYMPIIPCPHARCMESKGARQFCESMQLQRFNVIMDS